MGRKKKAAPPEPIVEACRKVLKARLAMWEAEQELEDLFGCELPRLNNIVENLAACCSSNLDKGDGELLEEQIREEHDLRHVGIECVECGELIEDNEDGESSPHGSMHSQCARLHEIEHPTEW